MENACHRCGTSLPESATFCSSCGAPQIRVTPRAQDETRGASSAGGAYSGESEGVGELHRLNWRSALPSAVKAAIVMAVGTFLLATLFPVWMLGGGWFAVSLYRRKSFAREVSISQGAKLGALTGLLGFALFSAITSVVIAIETFVLHQQAQLRDALRVAIEQAASKNQDPRVHQMMQWVQTPEGLALLFIMSLVLLFFAFLILGSLGGLFGASTLRRRSS